MSSYPATVIEAWMRCITDGAARMSGPEKLAFYRAELTRVIAFIDDREGIRRAAQSELTAAFGSSDSEYEDAQREYTPERRPRSRTPPPRGASPSLFDD